MCKNIDNFYYLDIRKKSLEKNQHPDDSTFTMKDVPHTLSKPNEVVRSSELPRMNDNNSIDSRGFKEQSLRGQSLKRKHSPDSCTVTSVHLCNKSKPNQLNSSEEENRTCQSSESPKQGENPEGIGV